MLDGLLYLTSADVRAVCAYLDPVAVVSDALADHADGGSVLPEESYLAWSPSDYSSSANGDAATTPTMARSLGMPGLVGRSNPAIGTKIINANPANPSSDIPRASGLTVLFHPETARPICIMEAAYISSLRTASVTVLAAELVRSRPTATVALIGAGAQANAHLGLLLSHLPSLERVTVFDHADGCADRLRQRHEGDAREREVALETAKSPRQAIADAELIVTVTTATTGYIPFDWLAAGTTLVSVSLDDPMPDVVARCDLLVVDDWKLIRHDGRRLLGRLFAEGLVCGPEESPGAGDCRQVDVTIGDLVLERHPGRRRPEEIVLVNPFGLAIEDLALAQIVYEDALSRGLGRRLPFEG